MTVYIWRMLDFGQFDFGQFDFGTKSKLAEIEIGRSRKKKAARSRNWPKSTALVHLGKFGDDVCVCFERCVGQCVGRCVDDVWDDVWAMFGRWDERLVRQNSQTCFLSGSALTGCCKIRGGLRVVDVESGVCVHSVRVVHGMCLCKRWMQIAVTASDF